MISLRKFVGVGILVIVTILAAMVNSAPTSRSSGVMTIRPIPQRPPYAPNPWDYPKPTPSQLPGRP